MIVMIMIVNDRNDLMEDTSAAIAAIATIPAIIRKSKYRDCSPGGHFITKHTGGGAGSKV